MNLGERIEAMFPAEKEIPKSHLLTGPIEQHEFLVNGELRQWSGPMEDVFSPVRIKTPSGLKPRLIGRFPLLTEQESLEALRVFSIRTLVAAKAIDINKAIITKIVRERKSNFLATDFIL